MKDELNWKPKGKKSLDRPKKRQIDDPNQNFRILGVDNLEELANDKEQQRRLYGAVQPIRTEETCLFYNFNLQLTKLILAEHSCTVKQKSYLLLTSTYLIQYTLWIFKDRRPTGILRSYPLMISLAHTKNAHRPLEIKINNNMALFSRPTFLQHTI